MMWDSKIDAAIVALLQAKSYNPKSILPIIRLGDLFYQNTDLENAKKYYELATKVALNIDERKRAWSKYLKILLDTYDWEGFLDGFKNFSRWNKDESLKNRLSGDFYFKQGQITVAVPHYQKALQNSKVDDDLYQSYAQALFTNKQYLDAQFFYSLVLSMDPYQLKNIFNIAHCIAESNTIDKGIEFLKNYLKVHPLKKAEVFGKIAELYLQKGDDENAQKYLNEAIRLDKMIALLWKIQAKVFLKSEGIEKDARKKAIDSLGMYVKLNTSDPEGYFMRYQIFLRMPDYEAARFELLKVYQITPRYPNLHYHLAYLYFIQGNYIESKKELSIELKNNPHSFQSKVLMGRVLIEQNNFQEALQLLMDALSQNPNSAEAKHHAGWANYKLKNFIAATSLFESAIKLDASNPVLYKRLGVIYRDMGDMNQSCNTFKKYLAMEPDAVDKADFAACF
jgi:tetratricopeptide (TPR) repeat protein